MKSQRRICFTALENVYYACHLFFFPFPPSGHNGFCVSLLKSSRIWTFSWHLLLRKHRQKWLAYWEQPALRDEESVWFAEGLKTIMRTRALNKWVLMKCSHQDNTSLCVLHPGCSVQVCRGSQRNLNPYHTVTAIFTTKRARNKDRHRVGQKSKHKAEESNPASLLHQKHHHHHYTSFFLTQLNWDIKYCYFPLLWRAGDPCCGLVGQHPGKGPQETKACVVCVCVCMCMRACMCQSESQQEASHNNAVWVSSGPRLTKRTPAVTGPSGRPQWLIASPRTHTYMHRRTPSHPDDPAWHPVNTQEGMDTQKTQAQKETHRRAQQPYCYSKAPRWE